MSPIAFTGERLPDHHALYGVDLARHLAAYAHAEGLARDARVLDLGCGTGYGCARLAAMAHEVVAVDRIAPEREHRRGRLHYVRADLAGLPLAAGRFDLVVSFQVIEHLIDPGSYLDAIARVLRPGGTAVLTTPNLLQSERENPFHVHEYEAEELALVLAPHFEGVEVKGVGMSDAVARYHDQRLRRIRRITRLDPLRLRHRLPRGIVDPLFARFSTVVRRGIQQSEGLPDATVDDFPVGAATAESLDLLAVCRAGSPG